MKISIENHVLHTRFGDERSFEMLKDAGFDCVDYSFYWLQPEMDEKVLGDGYLDYACKVRNLLDDLQLECNQAHAPFEVKSEDPFDVSNVRYLRLIRSLESASIMGAKCIIVHALTPPEGVSMLEYNYRFYKSLEPYCEKFGIKVAVENLFTSPRDPETKLLSNKKFGKPAYMMELMNKLSPDNFVICIDLGHAKLTGNNPEDFIRGIDGSRLKALHVQDNDFVDDCHILPFNGKLNWANITESLAEVGYDSELTLEVFGFLGKMEDEMLPEALKFAAATAKHLVKKIEAQK